MSSHVAISSINAPANDGVTPLDVAENSSIVKYLIQNGAVGNYKKNTNSFFN